MKGVRISDNEIEARLGEETIRLFPGADVGSFVMVETPFGVPHAGVRFEGTFGQQDQTMTMFWYDEAFEKIAETRNTEIR